MGKEEVIDVNALLLQPLREDYERHIGQLRLQSGLDYMEAMLKFLGILSVSVVKSLDEEVYGRIILGHFKEKPSLGDFKSLATHCYIKANAKTLHALNNPLYEKLYTLFHEGSLGLELLRADDIITENAAAKPLRIKSIQELLDNYAVGFRNKVKGHGASFKDDDVAQRDALLKNLDTLITALQDKIASLLEDGALQFYKSGDEAAAQEHRPSRIFARHGDTQAELSPLLIHVECRMFSCREHHRVKLFFYNDGSASKSYYLDYGFNHYYFFSQNNEVSGLLKEMLTLQKEINAHSSSDGKRQSDLLATFVGREEELRSAKSHILEGFSASTPTAITLRGKPGTGKSAFVSQLQQEIIAAFEGEALTPLSYIFYARKGEMSSEEEKFFYNKLSAFLGENGIAIKKLENFEEATVLERLQNLFESFNAAGTQPLILSIDGLDEFKDAAGFLSNLPLSSAGERVHFIFSTRGYTQILDALQGRLFNTQLKILAEQSYRQDGASITLGGLSAEEVNILLDEVLPRKELNGTLQTYENIREEVYAKSEGLPLYIHYICQQLRDLDVTTTDIAQAILNYSKALPKGLDAFYHESFKNLGTIASKLLYIFYFSRTHVTFDALYALTLKMHDGVLDRKEFHNSYFSAIEIYLNKDTHERYTFYHLSVKEAIRNYFKSGNGELRDIYEIDLNALSQQVEIPEQNHDVYALLFSEFYYLTERSDLFRLLNDLIAVLKEKRDDALEEYFAENFLTLLYRFIWFRVMQENISAEALEAGDYTGMKSFELSDEVKALIGEFFGYYERSAKTDIEEIRFAFELALLSGEYAKVLACFKDYKEAFLKLFADIIWTLEAPHYQSAFKELKAVWSGLVSDFTKKMLIRMIVENSARAELNSAQKVLLFERAFDIAQTMEDEEEQKRAVEMIIESCDEHALLERSVKVAESMKSDFLHALALACLTDHSSENALTRRALEMAAAHDDDEEISTLLRFIVINAQTGAVLEEVLEVADSALYGLEQAQVLDTIAAKADYEAVYERFMEMTEFLDSDDDQASVLASLAVRKGDSTLLERAVEVAESLEDETEMLYSLTSVAARSGESALITRVLGLIEGVEEDNIKAYHLMNLLSKTEQSVWLNRTVEIAKTIENERTKGVVFALVGRKTEDADLQLQILEYAEQIEGKRERAGLMATVARRSENSSLLRKVLVTAESINDTQQKERALASVAEHVDDPELLEAIEASLDEPVQIIKRRSGKRDKSILKASDAAPANKGVSADKLDLLDEIGALLDSHDDEPGWKKGMETEPTLYGQLYFVNTFRIFDAIEIATQMAPYDILAFYGFAPVQEGEELYEGLLDELMRLSVERDGAEEAEDEAAYERLSGEGERIKEQLLEDAVLLERFSEQFGISKMKLKRADFLEIVTPENG